MKVGSTATQAATGWGGLALLVAGVLAMSSIAQAGGLGAIAAKTRARLPAKHRLKPDDITVYDARSARLEGKWATQGKPALENSPVLVLLVPALITEDVKVTGGGQTLSPEPDSRTPQDKRLPHKNYYLLPVKVSGHRIQSRFMLVHALGDVIPLVIEATILLQEPAVLAAPACERYGVSLLPDPDAPPASYAPVVFLGCVRSDDNLELGVWSYTDRKWAPSAKEWAPSREGSSLNRATGYYLTNGEPPPEPLALTDLKKVPNGRVFLIRRNPVPRRWSLIASVGPTIFDYVEEAPSRAAITLSQVGLTGKIQASYQFVPGKWDAAFGFFGTLAPLKRSPDTLAPARWLGLNFRLGYILALDPLRKNVISLLPGYYLWSMFVEGDRYGVKSLNGPQLVFTYTRELAGRVERLGMYAKYAAMASDGAITSLANREFALGLSAAVRFEAVPRPFSFAADASTLRFTQRGYTIRLNTYSFSVGYSF